MDRISVVLDLTDEIQMGLNGMFDEFFKIFVPR